MKLGSTIITLLLALGSLGALWFTSNSSVGGVASQDRGRLLLTQAQLPVDEVHRITLTRRRSDGSAESMTFERVGADWGQVKPFTHPMDPFSIRQLAVQARELEVFDTLDPGMLPTEQSSSALRLDPPDGEMTYEWPSGSLTLHLGRRSVAGRAYVRIAGTKEVHVVSHQLHERSLEMEPKEWRDRTLFPGAGVGIESSRIEAIQGADDRMVLERQQKTWSMLEPVRTRVDENVRDAYLQAVAVAKGGGFILDQPTNQDLARFGLASPVATLAVYQSQDQVQRLLVGSRVGASSQDRFGIIEGRPTVLRLTAAVLGALFRQPQNLVAPTGSGAQPADVKALVIRTGGAELKLERELERWRAPDLANVDVDPRHVQELLDQLTVLRAPAVQIREYPRDMEVATITLYGFDSKAIDTIRIAQDKETDRWMLENGDNVLRIFPAGLKIRVTAADFGL